MVRRNFCLLIALLLGILLVGCEVSTTVTALPSPTLVSNAPARHETPTTEPRRALTPVLITDVVDGDTVEVRIDGRARLLRLIGIDAPEIPHRQRAGECFGREATAKTSELVSLAEGRGWLEEDISETDRYGRLLRYIWLELPAGRQMLNQELVRLGYARARAYPPDVKYQDGLMQAQTEAQAHDRGLWGACAG